MQLLITEFNEVNQKIPESSVSNDEDGSEAEDFFLIPRSNTERKKIK